VVGRFRFPIAARAVSTKSLAVTGSLGVVFLLLAVTGGPVKALGLELPALTQPSLRIAFTVVGGLLLAMTAMVWLVGRGKAALVGDRHVVGVPPRNRHFIGRKELLVAVRSLLQKEGGCGACVLYGAGGIGKTQLAVEYVYRNVDHYDLVCWIPAERKAVLVSRLAELARFLDLEERSDPTLGAREVLNELRRRSRWLLVFDNVESAEDLADCWPSAGQGHVIVTSRHSVSAAQADAIEHDSARFGTAAIPPAT
jgi:hypothetical protein